MPVPKRLRSVAFGLTTGFLSCGVGVGNAADVSIVGTGDGVEIIRSIAMAYSAKNASTRIIVPPSIGSRGAIAAVGGRHEMLGRITGPLSPAEEAFGLQLHPLARLPVAVITHPELLITGLGSAELGGLLSGKITNWKQLGGPDQRVKLVRSEDEDPVWLALRNAVPGLSKIGFSDRAKLATSAQDVIDTVRSTPGAVGIIPYSNVYAHVVSALALDGKHPSDKDYPASITLAIVYRAGALSSEAAGFMAFAGSPESAAIAARFGADPLGRK